MPGSGHSVRQPMVERNAVEARAFYPVVSGDGPQGDLHDPQGGNYEEEFHGGTLGWRRLQSQQRILIGKHLLRRRALLGSEIPDHASNASQKEHETDNAPNDRVSGGLIADQSLMRPVLGVGDV